MEGTHDPKLCKEEKTIQPEKLSSCYKKPPTANWNLVGYVSCPVTLELYV